MIQNECMLCGGEGTLLGRLGNLTHYRCRRCGMDWSVQDTDAQVPDRDDPTDGPRGPAGGTPSLWD